MESEIEPEKSKTSEENPEAGPSTVSETQREESDGDTNLVIDYPPTPERVPPDCVTPPPGPRKKKPTKKRRSKSLDGKDDDSSEEDGRSSPEDGGCPICLEKIKNIAKTDTCFHEFCFTCLVEWSKVRPVCPLCKSKFSYVMHNIRSDTDYERYDLPTVADRVEETLHGHLSDFMFNRGFRYHTTRTNQRLRQRRDELEAQLQNLILPAFPDRIPSRSHFRRRRGPGTSDFRRDVYARDLWVEPMADVTGRYRNCTPEWYRTNEAQTHRLVPFLNRELIALLEGGPHQSQQAYLTHQITEWVTRFEITSPEMRDHLLPYLGLRTEHFQHELYNFARSTFDLIGYDRNAQYQPRRLPTAEVVSSGTESDTEQAGTAQRNSDTVRPILHSFPLSSAFGVIQSSLEVLNADSSRDRRMSPDRSSRRRSRSPVNISRSRSADRREGWRQWRKQKRDQMKDRYGSRRRSRSQDRASGSGFRRRSHSRERDRILTSRHTEFTVEWPPRHRDQTDSNSSSRGADRSSSVLERSFDVFGNSFRHRQDTANRDRTEDRADSNSAPRTSQLVTLVRETVDSSDRGEKNRRKNKKPSRFMRTHQDLQRNFPHLLEDPQTEQPPVDPNMTIDLVSPGRHGSNPIVATSPRGPSSSNDAPVDCSMASNSASASVPSGDDSIAIIPREPDIDVNRMSSPIDQVNIVDADDTPIDLSLNKTETEPTTSEGIPGIEPTTSKGITGGPSQLNIRKSSSSSSTSSLEEDSRLSFSSSSSSATSVELSKAPVFPEGHFLSESTGLLQPSSSGDPNTSGREKNLSESSDDDSDLEVVDVVKAVQRKPREKDPEVVELSDSEPDSEPDHSGMQGFPGPNEPIEISSGSDEEEEIFPGSPLAAAGNMISMQSWADIFDNAWRDPSISEGDHTYRSKSKGKGTGKKSKPAPPPPPAESSSEDDLIVVKTQYNTVDPITKKEIVEPVRNKKCNHIYEKSTIYSMIDLARSNSKPVKCPYIGCNSRDFKKTDLVKDKEVLGHLQKVHQEREEENKKKAEEEAERRRIKAAKKKSGNESDQSADSIIEDVIEMIKESKSKEKDENDMAEAQVEEETAEPGSSNSVPEGIEAPSVPQAKEDENEPATDVPAEPVANQEPEDEPPKEEANTSKGVKKKKGGGGGKTKEKPQENTPSEDSDSSTVDDNPSTPKKSKVVPDTDEESYIPLSKSKRQRKRKAPNRLNESWSGSDLDSDDENSHRKRPAASSKAAKRKVPRGKTLIKKKVTTESTTWFFEKNNPKEKSKNAGNTETAGPVAKKSKSKAKAAGTTEPNRPRRKGAAMSYVESSSEDEF